VFANADWEFLPRFTLTAGARYTTVREGLRGCLFDGGNGVDAAYFGGVSNALRAAENLPPGPAIPPGGCVTLNDVPAAPGGKASLLPYSADLARDEHNVPWRVGLNFKPGNDELIYASISRGFKAGGFPASLNTNASQFEPVTQERLTSYEVGVKESLWNGAVRPNLSLFYYDYVNKQVKVYNKTVLGYTSTYGNLPQSTVKGLDFDVTITPIQALTIHPSLTYIHSAAGDFSTYSGTGVLSNVHGNPLNFAPNLTALTDVEYVFNIRPSYEAFIGGDLQYNSKTYADLAKSLEIPDYTTCDLRFGIRASSHWHVSAWVHNLADHFYYTNIFSAGDSFVRVTGQPRTFGLTIGADF
jgi:iron complex outermembrane recepter protein